MKFLKALGISTNKKLGNQKAVVFGMEARISLVVLSIVSLAVAINKLALNESMRLAATSSGLETLKDRIINYYKLYHTDLMELNTIYSQSADVQNKFFGSISDVKYDGWNKEWVIKVFKADANVMTAFGEPVEPKCIVIFSSGADGYHYLANQYSATTYDECINNVGLSDAAIATTKSDDMFFKFTTIDLEIEANKDVTEKLASIQEALYSYAQAAKNIRVKYCEDLGSEADDDAKCDTNGNGFYIKSEDIDVLNFYPKSSVDATAAKYADESKVYNNAVDADMESLLEKIRMPASYRTDLLGRKLVYNSNVDNSTGITYYASVKYKK